MCKLQEPLFKCKEDVQKQLYHEYAKENKFMFFKNTKSVVFYKLKILHKQNIYVVVLHIISEHLACLRLRLELR